MLVRRSFGNATPPLRSALSPLSRPLILVFVSSVRQVRQPRHGGGPLANQRSPARFCRRLQVLLQGWAPAGKKGAWCAHLCPSACQPVCLSACLPMCLPIVRAAAATVLHIGATVIYRRDPAAAPYPRKKKTLSALPCQSKVARWGHNQRQDHGRGHDHDAASVVRIGLLHAIRP